MSDLDSLKLMIREEDTPYFSDEQLMFYLSQYGSVKTTAYHCLLIKAEDTSISLSGYSSTDTSKYFRRLASQYRPSNSGILRG